MKIPLLEPLGDREFLVREGDNLEKVARAFYNEPTKSAFIYEQKDNRKTIGEDPSLILPGTILKLPDDPDVPLDIHRVLPNETLGAIAIRCYGLGLSGKSTDIHFANRDVLGTAVIDPTSATALQTGQKLKLYGCTTHN